jgi:putative heme iron utilization protein
MPVMDHRTTPSPWAVPVAPRVNDELADDHAHKSTVSDADRARAVVSNNRLGVLSVVCGEPAAPFGVVVPYGTDANGAPYVSVRPGIASTTCITNGVAASLTIAETPLTANHAGGNGGISVVGTLEVILQPSPEFTAIIAEYTRNQPADAAAVKRGAARLFKLSPIRISMMSTSGDAINVVPKDYEKASADPLAAVAPSLVSHLSGDSSTLVLLVRAYGGQPAANTAELMGIDQFGMDLLVHVGHEEQSVRLSFTRPVATSEELRLELAAMARGARFKLGVG